MLTMNVLTKRLSLEKFNVFSKNEYSGCCMLLKLTIHQEYAPNLSVVTSQILREAQDPTLGALF